MVGLVVAVVVVVVAVIFSVIVVVIGVVVVVVVGVAVVVIGVGVVVVIVGVAVCVVLAAVVVAVVVSGRKRFLSQIDLILFERVLLTSSISGGREPEEAGPSPLNSLSDSNMCPTENRHFLGSGPGRGRSLVEWGDFPSVHPSILPSSVRVVWLVGYNSWLAGSEACLAGSEA